MKFQPHNEARTWMRLADDLEPEQYPELDLSALDDGPAVSPAEGADIERAFTSTYNAPTYEEGDRLARISSFIQNFDRGGATLAQLPRYFHSGCTEPRCAS